MSLHYYKLLLLSTEGSSINGYNDNDYFKNAQVAQINYAISTEDSRSKWYTEHEFCIKTVHHPPKKKHAPSPPPHTHTQINRLKVLSTDII